ncbi:Hypothetical protein PHPALM_5081 [Phytophthora palmivora]|uniref:Uncharacterized protein n=1 Tax=Phytophthora palmivora TaxID=4796 RepID=A0A2P4YIC0_9STRA|nr:Hypothetical protein PHPALM_5081 [Phytophthora palmivora]
MWSLFPNTSNNGLHRTSEFPLQFLQEAIDTRVDSKVYEVLRIERIRKELIQSTTTHKISSDPYQPKYNVFTCVQAAVLQGIPHVVLAMHRFNPTDVQLATWYALYRLKKDKQQMKSKSLKLNVALGFGTKLGHLYSFDRRLEWGIGRDDGSILCLCSRRSV